MQRVSDIFIAHVDDLDLSKDIHYKFIVDGEWCIDEDMESVKDNGKVVLSYIYNVLTLI